MLGGFILGLVAGGLAMWKWRDNLTGYVREHADPVREKADRVLETVQHRSEDLLDRAKEQVSSGIGRTRDKVRAGGPTEGPGASPE